MSAQGRSKVEGATEVEAFAIELPRDTSAPRLARSAVAERLGDHPELQDLLLCVSEVVTNAVLHARSPGQMRVRREGHRLVVEVSDGDPRQPTRRSHDLEAPTGRGLHLLDALTSSWGTNPVEGGKIVWFEFDLGGGGQVAGREGSPELDAAPRTSTVTLVGMPISSIHRRAGEHGEALRRELSLVHHTSSPDAVLVRLRELGQELISSVGGMNDAPDERLAQAVAAGESSLDLTYQLPVAAADAFERLDRLLDELDRYCADRDLLTLVTPPELLAYRRWWIGEIVEQLREGRAPRPWALPTDLPSDAAADATSTTSATIEVVGDLDLEQAPQLREELARRTEAGATDLVVDLSRCTFLDSTGLSLLITTHLRLRSEGGSLRLVRLPPQVVSVLELSGLTDVMT